VSYAPRALAHAFLAVAYLGSKQAAASEDAAIQLPLTAINAPKLHSERISFDLSPDGQWLGHTFSTGIDERDDEYTGPKLLALDQGIRLQAAVTNVATHETLLLGRPKASSWATVWSPDGKQVAFFSTADGEAGLWLWSQSTRSIVRFPNVAVRPWFEFEAPRWLADSHRIVCKIAPLPDENATADEKFSAYEKAPKVKVWSSKPERAARLVSTSAPRDESVTLDDSSDENLADLALLDTRTFEVKRLARKFRPRWYSVSPDQKYLAYTAWTGWEQGTQQPNYDIYALSLQTGQAHRLAHNVRLNYGIEVSWSPDSERLAYIESGPLGRGSMVILSIASSQKIEISAPVSFDISHGKRPPLWSPSGERLYAIGTDGGLWQVEPRKPQARLLSNIDLGRFTGIVSDHDASILFTTARKSAAWAIVQKTSDASMGLYRVDLSSGKAIAAVAGNQALLTVFNLDASKRSARIAYITQDQQHLPDAWIFDPGKGLANRVTVLNPGIERYPLGSARIVRWAGKEGQRLQGALLLPPNYEPGERLPLIVWVYGGMNGSEYVNRFGFWGNAPEFNFQVLATRGYAVLFPDIPLRQGETAKSVFDAVMSSVDKVIEDRIADPERLAVMGQSYGAYCVLSLITQSTRFKAAIITAAVTHPDLVSAYLEMSPDGASSSMGYFEAGQGNMGGTPWEFPERYRDNSPVFHLDRINTPLLIGQGGNDGALAPSAAIFAGLRRLSKEVEYRIYRDEGHVITEPGNVIDFWQRRLEFLDEKLGARRDKPAHRP
jgi:dipeptidyl aminopeptidase/acylaminoacyl peptidase